MTKAEAAQFLKVSEKSIERYVKAGKLHAYTEKVAGRTRPLVNFDNKELHNLKMEMEVEANQSLETGTKDRQAMSPGRNSMLAMLDRLTEVVEKTTEQQHSNSGSAVPIAEKLLLTKREAAALAGMSVSKIEELLKTKKLKGYLNTFGHGWRIKRSSLEDFVKNLR